MVYEVTQNKALRAGPGIPSELTYWLVTLMFNLVELNSANSAIDKEDSHNQEDMAIQRKRKFS